MGTSPEIRPELTELEEQLERLRLQQERDRRALDVLYHVSTACRGVASDRAIFDVLCHELRAVFPMDSCYIALCDLERPDTFRTALLYDEGLFEYVEETEFGPMTGRLVREGVPILIPDLHAMRETLDQYPTTFGNTQKLSRAWMGVPILLGQNALGIISLQSYTPAIFTEEDIDLLQRIGQVVAVALENANLIGHQRKLSDELALRVVARTEELAALSTIAAEMVLQQPLPALLDRALARILPLLDAAAGTVRLYDRERNLLVLLAQRGLPPDDARGVAEVPVDGSKLGEIVRENRPLVIEQDLISYAIANNPSLFDSLLGVPLRIGDQVIGSMALLDVKPRGFDQQQIDLAQVIGNQLAIAIENARLLEQRERQIRELSALAAISHAANTSLNLRMLLKQVYSALRGLMTLDAFVMSIYDARRDVIVEGIGIDDGKTYEYYASNEPLPPASLSAWVVRNRRTLHLRNVVEEMEHYPELSRILRGSGRPAASWLGVPMFDRDEKVIGTIVVQSYTVGVFSDRDEGFLESVAQQAALHVQNVTLLAQRERQIRELDAIGRIGQLVSATFDLEEILQVVYETLQGVTGAPIFYLLICDAATHVVTNAVFIEEGRRNDFGWVGNTPRPGSMTDWILRNREPLLYDDLESYLAQSADPEVRPKRFGDQRHARSWAGVPLLAPNGAAIGVLSVQHYQASLYDAQTLDFLSQVASHISLGVQKIKLLHERERQIRELDAIGRIGRLVSASFDLDGMLRIVYEILQQVTGAAAFYMIVCEPRSRVVSQAFYIERGTRLDDDWPGIVPPRTSLIGWILHERRPLVLSDLEAEGDRLAEMGIAPVMMENTVRPRAWVGVPLLADDNEAIGVISVQDEQPGIYDTQTVDLLSQVASHLSLGVQKINLFQERERRISENARLFAEAEAHAAAAERQAQRMALIHRVSLLLNSRVDPQETLDLAVQELAKLFGVEHVGIMLFDEAADFGTIVAEHPHGMHIREQLAVSRQMLQSYADSRRPLLIESVAESDLSPGVREMLERSGVISTMIAPLVSRARVIGAIGLDSIGRARAFSEEEQSSFTTIAATVAAAFENARLFAAEHAARRTADTLREVARVLSSTFDSGEVLDLILDQLRTVIGYDSASIMLQEGETLRVAAQRGLDGEGKATRQSFSITGRSGAGMAVSRRRPVLIDDTTASPEWQFLAMSQQIRSWLGVPLISKGRVLGVLNIDSHNPNHFSARDVEVALAFANHAAVALENAQLYQESVTRVEQELEIAHQIQSNLFPRDLPHVPGVTIAARAVPARETGGDFYDIVPLGGNRFGLLIGDASGKSIPGAMLMAVARSTARSEARDHELPETVMRETNRWIALDVPPRAFVALSYASLDAEHGRMALANAGQLAPLRRSADGTVEYLEVPGPTLPLGIMPNTPYAALEVALQPGDTILFCTDGIVEAHNPQRELFGFERLEQLLREQGDLPPDQLIDALLRAVEAFSGSAAQHDDMTLLVLRVEESLG
ncbi:MAG TPA: GAF domain-containing protein [Roseiflexaceae bacterium]|nr:GAF domain-containing protein [Roseiflexaceae bacterium]